MDRQTNGNAAVVFSLLLSIFCTFRSRGDVRGRSRADGLGVSQPHGYVRVGWGEMRKSKRDDPMTWVALAMQVAILGVKLRVGALQRPSGTG
eukprot:2370942-Prymnesium_polylepis.2